MAAVTDHTARHNVDTQLPSFSSPLFPGVSLRAAVDIGILQFNSNNLCHDCGVSADSVGVHAVTCTRSGDITVLRDTVRQILRKAGFSAQPEQQLPDHPERRPADVLVNGWKGRTLTMVNFTIVTPIRASSNLPASSSTTFLDRTAGVKLRQSQAFVADSFGALRCDPRAFVSSLISQRSRLSSASAGRATIEPQWQLPSFTARPPPPLPE